MAAVVSCILVKEGKILLLQRSQEVGTYKGLWGGITGFVEPDETPLQTAIKEIYEETKISEHDIVLKQRLDPISFTDEYKGQQYDWFVHPFIFLLITEETEYENADMRTRKLPMNFEPVSITPPSVTSRSVPVNASADPNTLFLPKGSLSRRTAMRIVKIGPED